MWNGTGTGKRTDTMLKYRSRLSSHISCSVKVKHEIVQPIFPGPRPVQALSELAIILQARMHLSEKKQETNPYSTTIFYIVQFTLYLHRCRSA